MGLFCFLGLCSSFMFGVKKLQARLTLAYAPANSCHIRSHVQPSFSSFCCFLSLLREKFCPLSAAVSTSCWCSSFYPFILTLISLNCHWIPSTWSKYTKLHRPCCRIQLCFTASCQLSCPKRSFQAELTPAQQRSCTYRCFCLLPC